MSFLWNWIITLYNKSAHIIRRTNKIREQITNIITEIQNLIFWAAHIPLNVTQSTSTGQMEFITSVRWILLFDYMGAKISSYNC